MTNRRKCRHRSRPSFLCPMPECKTRGVQARASSSCAVTYSRDSPSASLRCPWHRASTQPESSRCTPWLRSRASAASGWSSLGFPRASIRKTCAGQVSASVRNWPTPRISHRAGGSRFDGSRRRATGLKRARQRFPRWSRARAVFSTTLQTVPRAVERGRHREPTGRWLS
jgi:hypothetical protein